MSKKHDEFIAAFKRVEQGVKLMPGVPAEANFKWLEDRMNDQAIQTRMRMCRMIRNYIQHESDYEAFIEVSPGMIQFLDCLYASITKHLQMFIELSPNSANDVVHLSDTISKAADMCASSGRNKILCVRADGTVVGVITSELFTTVCQRGISFTSTLSSVLNILSVSGITFVRGDDALPADGLGAGKIYAITMDGTKDTRLKGIVYT